MSRSEEGVSKRKDIGPTWTDTEQAQRKTYLEMCRSDDVAVERVEWRRIRRDKET